MKDVDGSSSLAQSKETMSKLSLLQRRSEMAMVTSWFYVTQHLRCGVTSGGGGISACESLGSLGEGMETAVGMSKLR